VPNFIQTVGPYRFRCELEEGGPRPCTNPAGHDYAAELEKTLIEQDPETVAAIIAEPVQGAGGVIVPPAGYFEKVQAVLRKYDILFIADEVITGFGRTGKMFATETFALKPDMITLAKALSGGYQPISALMINQDVYDTIAAESARIGTFGHGFTYSAHPVPAAVALETLRLYEEHDILSHVRAMSPILQNGLRRFADYPLVGEVRGIGLIAGIELVADKTSKRPFDPAGSVGPTVARHAQKHGLILRAMGDIIAICPPLIIQPAEIETLLERLGRALNDTETEHRNHR
jgi:4-aminobutyrate--pyruvate transaminase